MSCVAFRRGELAQEGDSPGQSGHVLREHVTGRNGVMEICLEPGCDGWGKPEGGAAKECTQAVVDAGQGFRWDDEELDEVAKQRVNEYIVDLEAVRRRQGGVRPVSDARLKFY